MDFIIEDQGNIVPLEVKSATNTKAKSYRRFCEAYHSRTGFKVSLKNIAMNQEGDTISVSLPLYMIHSLKRYL